MILWAKKKIEDEGPAFEADEQLEAVDYWNQTESMDGFQAEDREKARQSIDKEGTEISESSEPKEKL